MKRDTLPEPVCVDLDFQALYFRVIKRLGRNARPSAHASSSRADGVLDGADAAALWSGLLEQQFTPSQEAALLMGLRVHGESAAMLAAFAAASQAQMKWIESPDRPVVVLMCLGVSRKQPSLAALLAIELAQAGLPALILTASRPSSSNAGCSAEVMRRLGMAPASETAQAAHQLATDRIAWICLDTVAPPVARVIGRRAELGFRNSAHAMVKLVSPIAGPSIIVAHYTHAAYRERLADAIQLLRANALLIRGTEGDPIAWEAYSHPTRAWCAGVHITLPEEKMRSSQRPRLQLANDDPVNTTAAFIREVRSGSQPCPASITAQIRQLLFIAASMRSGATPGASA